MLSQGNRNDSLNAGHVGNDPKIRIRRPSRKMNESFLFPLATSTETMKVTWKMNDERDLICIRQMNESSAGYGSLDHFSRDLHRLSTGS